MRKFALLLALPVAACVNNTPVTTAPFKPTAAEMAQARAAVADEMKDPASAQFREGRSYILSNGDRAYCGEINAKNSYGGYNGFTPYWLRMRNGVKQAVVYADSATQGCAEADIGQTTISG